jgi:hypothetical protein
MQLGDNLRMQLSEKQVVSIDRDVLDIEVLELCLRDSKGSLLLVCLVLPYMILWKSVARWRLSMGLSWKFWLPTL